MRKQLSRLFACAVIISTLSCTKNQSLPENILTKKDAGVASPHTFRQNSSNSDGRQLPSSTVFVTLSGGKYISTYQGGITFGTTLPHPNTADPTGFHDGESINTIGYVNWTLNPVDVTSKIEGAYFDLLEPTFPGAVDPAQVTIYFNKLHIYYAGTGVRPAPIGSTTGSGGIKEVRGILVRDHLSPTMMSVCADTWQGNFLELATITQGTYSIKVYGPSYSNGTINKVKVTQNTASVTVTSFSLTYYTYTNSVNAQYMHVGGTIHLATGPTLTISSEIYVYAE